jgi:hypothetical protein
MDTEEESEMFKPEEEKKKQERDWCCFVFSKKEKEK